MREPVYPGYLADPFLTSTASGYLIYGTGDPGRSGSRTFETIVSDDLERWRRVDPVLRRPDPALGDDFWAPEVVLDDGRYWMYYSVGHGITGHHIRVASSASPLGPFVDEGVNLTSGETFAIDAHPFRDVDGSWYLFFARDVLDSAMPGTHLAVVRLASMTTTASDPRAALSPYASWQIYERGRLMYGEARDWYTLEGPSVILHDGTYHLFFSGGSWEGAGYGVAFATAAAPLGPWIPGGGEEPIVLNSRSTGLIGPGHNSLLRLETGEVLIAYHAWDTDVKLRRTFIDPLDWVDSTPTIPTVG
jgi:arabinan endo-1,5-alpha-L-arabinosidase